MTDHGMLNRFYECTGIPLQVFDSTEDSEPRQSYGCNFYPNPALLIIQCAINSPHSVCYTVSDEFLYCGLVRVQNSPEYIVVGPAKDFECTHKQARKILVGLQQPEIRAFDLLPWLNAIPRCTMRRFSEVLLFMDYLLNNSKDQTAVHIAYHPGPVPVKVKETSFIFMEHFNDIMEKKLVLCIEYGKVDEIEKLLNDLLSQTENMPNITPDPERAFKNIFIFCIGVASRAALKGGLDYDTVIEASDQYIRRIELVNGYASISSLLRQMFMDYTQRIARSNSLIKTTSIVKKIDKEISSYLYKKITPTVISRNLGINCSYLCRLFKAETGKTISTYINEVKINASKYLLKSTDLPVVEISEDLGYSSENYFYKVFKEITSMTPVEYRNSGS